MKALIMLLFVMLLIKTSSFSQSMPANQPDKSYYLTKSRHQKTLGWIMLGGGVALTGAGIAIAAADDVGDALGGNNKNNSTGTVLAVVGLASAAGSIPVFIGASHNKHRAAALAFSIQKIQFLSCAANLTAAIQPALTLKISL